MPKEEIRKKKKLLKLNMHNNNKNNTYNIKLTDSRNMFSQQIKISRLGKCNRYDIIYFGDKIKIPYGKKYILNTNIGIEVPENILGIISNHSETYNHSWQLVTGPIIIDSDFCGEIVLEITNTDPKTTILQCSEKIAQISFIETCKVNLITIDNKKELFGGVMYDPIIEA